MDALAADYVRLALAAGTHYDGIVDAYYGPAELRTQAEASAGSPAVLAQAAADMRSGLDDSVDAQRRRWLQGQLVALETLMRRLAGEPLEYLEEVKRCFDAAPSATPSDAYDEVHSRLDELLPAGADLRQRLEERGRRLTVPPDRLAGIIDWLLGEVRADCARHFAMPEGDSLTISMVTGQPWSGYNWYDGELRSRVEVNTDLPVRATTLINLITHECFPGHHLEHAWKEQRLYRELGHAEVSVQLINTPEAYISEGLAELGGKLIIGPQRWQELFAEICGRAGITMDAHAARQEWEVEEVLHLIRGSGGDASLMLHAEGRPREAVVDFLEQRALLSRERAQKSLEFISHPLWRTYVFCYADGERLLADWVSRAGDEAARHARFFRLLTEQLTPSGIAAEIEAANFTS
jgi:hypothetical protein